MPIPTFLENRQSLYFFYMNGCGACEAAEPELAKFAAANPLLLVLRLQADGPHAASLGMKIKATPTYVFRRGTQGISREGAMTAKEIEKWLGEISENDDE